MNKKISIDLLKKMSDDEKLNFFRVVQDNILKKNEHNEKFDSYAIQIGHEDLLQAANDDDEEAQQFLGWCWMDGECGFPFNLSQAVRWYTLADRNGAKDAKTHLKKLMELTFKGYIDSLVDNDHKNVAKLKGKAVKVVDNKKESSDFLEKRNKNLYCSKGHKGGSIRVLGGLLPIRGSIGRDIEYYVDGKSPLRTGTMDGKEKWVTNGNLQVFFLRREAVDKYIFYAKFVDYYNAF